jgi:hypothetical protein
LALAIKAVVLLLAALGIANLWLAIATDRASSVLVSINGMRLLGRVARSKVVDPATRRWRFGLAQDDEREGRRSLRGVRAHILRSPGE